MSATLFCSILAGVLASSAAAALPNVLFVLVDDLGYAEIGANREVPDVEVMTPNIDKLVSSGIHLTRHYVHQYCTPTRTSVQSGRLPVHVSQGLGSPCDDNTGIPQNMTGMAEVLKRAGYTTAMAGKWDAGMVTPAHTPQGRGYDTSLNYFSHKNDFWSQANMQTCCESDQTIIDFWHTDKGASTLNNTDYSEFLYQRELVSVVEAHDPATSPLMLFYAPHVAHCPLQVPKFYYDKFGFMTDDEGECKSQTVNGTHTIDPHHPELKYKCRQQYHAMVNIMDEVVGNLTEAMQAKAGMWDNTLVIFSSDNGGPVDLSENAANNWPLRGGKYSLFEGGIRVAAFISGGLVPEQLRGTTNNGIVHIADWYSTLAALAGEDPTDHRAAAAGLPPIDSIDMWPFLSGKVAKSPREIIPVGNGCLVVGDYKLILSKSSPDFWQGPKFPNSSSIDTMHLDQGSPEPAEIPAQFLVGAVGGGGGGGAGAGAEPPVRPYPRLAPCYGGSNAALLGPQQWTSLPDTFGEVCTTARPFARVPCWNVQHSGAQLIMFQKSGGTNTQFGLRGTGASATLATKLQPGGCLGAATVGGELVVYDDCSKAPAGAVTTGWSHNATSNQIQTSSGGSGGALCVEAFLNGTTPNPPGPPPAPGFLFNVVLDPTEQINLFHTMPDVVANMTAALQRYVANYWTNKDKFANDCPSEDDDEDGGCACWMAKHHYGGFMGPFAMMGMDTANRP